MCTSKHVRYIIVKLLQERPGFYQLDRGSKRVKQKRFVTRIRQ